MPDKRDTYTERQQNESRPWRPWRPPRRRRSWWVLWAVGLLVALTALGWLVANLYPGIWQDITQKRVAMLIGIVVVLTVIIVLFALGGASLEWTGFGEKKLWDWLQLLLVPLIISALAFGLT